VTRSEKCNWPYRVNYTIKNGNECTAKTETRCTNLSPDSTQCEMRDSSETSQSIGTLYQDELVPGKIIIDKSPKLRTPDSTGGGQIKIWTPKVPRRTGG
jgi:hypothetical protein